MEKMRGSENDGSQPEIRRQEREGTGRVQTPPGLQEER